MNPICSGLPLGYRNGNALIPEGPGLGVELDDALAERYRL